MDRRKIVIALIVLLLLLGGLLLLNLVFNSAPASQRYDEVINTNYRIIALSELANKEAENFALQQHSQTIVTVTTSDTRLLTEYYKTEFPEGILPKASGGAPLEELEASSSGNVFDENYLDLVLSELERNLIVIAGLKQDANDDQSRALLETMHNNQSQFVEILREF